MPYTQEELKKLDFYQNLIDEDEQQYLQKKADLELQANISGSANRGAIVRDKSNTILLFEDPYQNQLQDLMIVNLEPLLWYSRLIHGQPHRYWRLHSNLNLTNRLMKVGKR